MRGAEEDAKAPKRQTSSWGSESSIEALISHMRRGGFGLVFVMACTPPVRDVVTIASASEARARVSTSAAASGPVITLSPAPKASTFVLTSASTLYDFRLSMRGSCPGDADATLGCAGPATLVVLDKVGVAVQTIALESAWVTYDASGAPLANANALYDLQGTVNVGDFDFDGHEDFAVQVDQSGPYGGPTYAVFLHAPNAERFDASDAFSAITRETLGFFQVDAAKKRLTTFAKSGCCYHVTEELEVVAGKPQSVFRHTEDATQGDFVLVTDETLVRGTWTKQSRRVPMPP